MSDILQRIRDLQFSDKSGAEKLLLSFLRDVYPETVTHVELRPLAISLNSFNGFMTVENGTRYFFKTHTESDTVINEYYNSGLLADAGYPVIRPIFQSTVPGKQILVYELIENPSVFDYAWDVEIAKIADFQSIASAQIACDQQLLQIYRNTLTSISAQENIEAPIHQLFFHRLTGGRLERFYGTGTSVRLPENVFSIEDVLSWQWTINGQSYKETLAGIIERAIRLLNPNQASLAVVGHGDAHNGNVFVSSEGLIYFDPAFAGKHDPLLDLVKPLFHNVFAMWMYFPDEKAQMLEINMMVDGGLCSVYHTYQLHPIREMFLYSKLDHVLQPLIRDLRDANLLRPDWRAFLKSALFCCPFLTMNLADSVKFNPKIALLGLAMSIEMGSESYGHRSMIDQLLDRVESSLSG
jgi:hypothetical protein